MDTPVPVQERRRRSWDLVDGVLEELSACWPAGMDLDLAALGLKDDPRQREFARLVQALLDQGFVTYESAESTGDSPRFRNTRITPSGRAALNVLRFLKTLS